MSETLTIDPTPPAEIVGEAEGVQLTAEEQDSLEVGEQIVAEQENLLAGKYKSAEELEKAYVELQSKLGSNEEDTEEEVEETVEELEASEDTEVSPAAELITSASQEYTETGEITDETMARFSEMSSADLVDAYMEIQAQIPDETTPTSTADLTESDINVVKNHVGGESSYNQLIDWAQDNLESNSQDAFDSIVNTGSVEAIKLAVSGLKAQMDESNGYEGRMLSGKAPQNSGDVFRSQAEVVTAMSDPRYDNDPAYRQDLIEKLDRSDVQF
jgi:hypothetical protein